MYLDNHLSHHDITSHHIVAGCSSLKDESTAKRGADPSQVKSMMMMMMMMMMMIVGDDDDDDDDDVYHSLQINYLH